MLALSMLALSMLALSMLALSMLALSELALSMHLRIQILAGNTRPDHHRSASERLGDSPALSSVYRLSPGVVERIRNLSTGMHTVGPLPCARDRSCVRDWIHSLHTRSVIHHARATVSKLLKGR
jgi:hypothetical protein